MSLRKRKKRAVNRSGRNEEKVDEGAWKRQQQQQHEEEKNHPLILIDAKLSTA